MIANPFAEATARALLDAVAAGSRACLAMVFGDERELQFRGPWVTRGYYKKPEETAVAFAADGDGHKETAP